MSGKDAGVVIPVKPVLAPEIVLDGVGKAERQLDRVDLPAAQLGRREVRRGEFTAGSVVRRRHGDIDPNEASQVADLWMSVVPSGGIRIHEITR